MVWCDYVYRRVSFRGEFFLCACMCVLVISLTTAMYEPIGYFGPSFHSSCALAKSLICFREEFYLL